MPNPEPKRSRLRQLLERPEARKRVSRAVASLLGVGILSIGVLGALVIWHLVRRGRLIQESLRPPRASPLNGLEFDRGPAEGSGQA
jgi:hypothetical protein